MDKIRIELAPAASRALGDLDIGAVTEVGSDLRTLGKNPFPRRELIEKNQRAGDRILSIKIQTGKIVIPSPEEANRFIRRI